MGNFKNNGLSWQREPIPVNSYDFRSDADGIAIPYSIYDVRANQGSVFIGVSHDTPAFAVNSLSKWWRYDGQKRYRKRTHMLVLADRSGPVPTDLAEQAVFDRVPLGGAGGVMADGDGHKVGVAESVL